MFQQPELSKKTVRRSSPSYACYDIYDVNGVITVYVLDLTLSRDHRLVAALALRAIRPNLLRRCRLRSWLGEAPAQRQSREATAITGKS